MSQPPRPPAFEPDASLRFTIQGGIMTSNLIAPTLTIDGFLAPVPITGSRTFAIMSGPHRLQVYSQWMRRYGHATLDVDVVPGQTLEVFYAPPYHQFTGEGAMGLTPQTRTGRGLVVGVWAFAGLALASAFALIIATIANLA